VTVVERPDTDSLTDAEVCTDICIEVCPMTVAPSLTLTTFRTPRSCRGLHRDSGREA
jgi:hypothetical protein